jgi:hypothetical protein
MAEQTVNSQLKTLDIGRCFNDAIAVYKGNIFILVLSAFLLQVLSVLSVILLLLPLGFLVGGYNLMMLNAMRSQEKKIELNDMFKMLSKFWPLCGLLFLQTIAVGFGFILLVIPGLILSTMWLFTFLMMVDKNTGVIASLKASWDMVKKGFWINLALLIIYLALSVLPGQIPVIGLLLNLFVIPFTTLLLVSAYIQQVS